MSREKKIISSIEGGKDDSNLFTSAGLYLKKSQLQPWKIPFEKHRSLVESSEFHGKYFSANSRITSL